MTRQASCRDLADVDVLVSMGFTAGDGRGRHRGCGLVQVPGAGLDRIDRDALRPGHAPGERLRA